MDFWTALEVEFVILDSISIEVLWVILFATPDVMLHYMNS